MRQEMLTSGRGYQKRKTEKIQRFRPRLVFTLAAVLVLCITAYAVGAPRLVPSIALVLESGPEFSEETGRFDFVIAAQVSGYPRPVIRFGRSDHRGAVDSGKTVIALMPGESYTLTVHTRNRFGGDSAELTLTAPETAARDEGPPYSDDSGRSREMVSVGEIVCSKEWIFTGDTVVFSLSADTLGSAQYEATWQMVEPDGTITAEQGSTLEWTAPLLWGTYSVTVTARDELGREGLQEQEFTVHPVLDLSVMPEWSGTVFENRSRVQGNYVFAGDDALNRMGRGFISFFTDVTLPFDFTVHRAVLKLTEPRIHGHPSVFHRSGLGLWVAHTHWGPRSIGGADWGLPATAIASYLDYDLIIDSLRWTENETLAKHVEERLKGGQGEIQFLLHFAGGSSNADNRMDGVEYDLENASLHIYLVLNTGR